MLLPATLQDSAWTGAPLGRSDRWLYTVCTRLLWAYVEKHASGAGLQLEEPLLGSPLPVYWKARLISQDLANTALEVASIRRVLGDRSLSNILEIGAGYGRTAYVLLNLYPESRYTIVDVEPALSISRWYLSALFPSDRLRFVAASDLDEISDSFSLSISISSLQEMTPAQIKAYIEFMDKRTLRGGAVYLKQWTEWHNRLDNFTAKFIEYPIPSRWKLLLAEPAPVQTRFTQAMWEL